MEETAPATPPADSQGGKGDFLLNFGLVVAAAGFLLPGSHGMLGPVFLWLLLGMILDSGWLAAGKGRALASMGLFWPAAMAAVGLTADTFAFGSWCIVAGAGLAGWGTFLNTGFKLIGSVKKTSSVDGDQQFRNSFAAYLMVTIGLFATWTADGASGTENWLGGVTLVLTLLALIASWSGMWKLPSMKEVTGKLGLILFLAPLEGALYGFLGLVAALMGNSGSENFTASFWPSGVSAIPGPAMVLLGSLIALMVLFGGAKTAVKMEKERKAEERAARKASRQSSGTES